jgi:hypothetical protein
MAMSSGHTKVKNRLARSRNRHDRAAFRAQRLDAFEDRIPGLRVDANCWLVEQDELGVVDQRGREVQPALHTSRIGECAIVGPVLELHELQSRSDASCLSLLPRCARLDRYAGHNEYKIRATSR